jgi:hypothetical protein
LYLKINGFIRKLLLLNASHYKVLNNGYLLFFNLQANFLINFKYLINLYLNFFKVFFFKLKLRGLGYRIKKISVNVFRFFFAFNHFFYFFCPINMVIKYKKRYLLLLSSTKSKLNNIFSHLLIIKKLDFYKRHNSFLVANQILYIKKKK